MASGHGEKKGSTVRELDLREVQLLLTEMLREFDAFCSFHHLEYRLDHGTLLGAVRHKGFIPWDDDIDVSMPRPDYQRLTELAVGKESLESFPSHLHFEDYTTGLPKSFIKLFNSHTSVELPSYYPKKPINELCIDIFPIDGMPSDKDEIRKRYEHAHELAALHKKLCSG